MKRESFSACRTAVHILLLLLSLPAFSTTLSFEDGSDGANIATAEPGVQFTTTAGYDWIYGDWRTGNYNGPYPSGSYSSFGNLDTGTMGTLSVEAPNIAYVFVHDSGNYWFNTTTNTPILLKEWAQHALGSLFATVVNALVSNAEAATPGAHDVAFDLFNTLAIGNTVDGTIAITNNGASDDTVQVIVQITTKTQNGTTYHTYLQQTFDGIDLAAGATEQIPFSVDLPFIDGMLFGSDSLLIEAIIIGEQGNGYNSLSTLIVDPALPLK